MEQYWDGIYWIGGSPCSGKTSISARLAASAAFEVYHLDDRMAAHAAQADPIKHPTICRVRGMDWDQVWMRPVDVLLRDMIAYYQEEHEMMLADLATLPERPLLVEGTGVLPAQVMAAGVQQDHALWIVPTEAFQRAHYRDRGPWVEMILSQCSDPEKAFANWMARDAAYAQWVVDECARLGLSCIQVDGQQSVEDLAAHVARRFEMPVFADNEFDKPR